MEYILENKYAPLIHEEEFLSGWEWICLPHFHPNFHFGHLGKAPFEVVCIRKQKIPKKKLIAYFRELIVQNEDNMYLECTKSMP